MSDNQRSPVPSQVSQAHKIEPINDGKLGDASKNLSSQFEKAKNAQLQRQAAANQNSPNKSYAHEIDPIKDGKLGEASKSLNSQFDRAKSAQQDKAQGDQRTAPSGERAGSQMVQKDQPVFKPAPPPAIRTGPDRNAYNEKLAADRERAKTLNESIKSRHNEQKNIDFTHGRDKNNDDRSR